MITQPFDGVTGPQRRVLPLPGPLDVDPVGEVANLQTARKMLGSALVDVDLGAHDRQVIAWLTGTDISTIVTVASLLRRAFQAGLTTGRAERVDEMPTVQTLRAQLDVAMTSAEVLREQLAQRTAERDTYRADKTLVQANARVVEAERDRATAEYARARAEALAGDHDRNALTRILAAAADIQARFDAEKVSAQGAFERLLQAIESAVGGAR